MFLTNVLKIYLVRRMPAILLSRGYPVELSRSERDSEFASADGCRLFTRRFYPKMSKS
jgi:hypothetical protein